MRFESSRPLRVIRRQDWEDALFSLQLLVTGRIAKAALFFEVRGDGSFVLSPDEAVTIVTSHGSRKWAVAVARDNGEVFGLYGLPDPELSFQQLTQHSRLSISSEADAERAAFLFFKTVKNLDGETLVYTSMQLRHRVERHYHHKNPKRRSRSLAAKWWRRFQKHPLTVPLGVRAAQSDSGQEFVVSLAYTEAVNYESIALAVLWLKVSASGHCEVIGRDITFGGS